MDNNEFVSLRVDYEAFKENTSDKLEELKKISNDLNKRITSIEISKEKTDYQYEQIMQTLKKLNDITIPGLVKEIEALKNKPAERYNLVINTIISSLAGGIAGYILKAFL